MGLEGRGGVYTSEIAIYVLNKNHQVEAIIRNSDTSTVEIPDLVTPKDIAVDSQDRLFICDSYYPIK